MQTNKRVEIVAETLRQIVPDFTVSQSYATAVKILEAVESVNNEEVCEPTA